MTNVVKNYLSVLKVISSFKCKLKYEFEVGHIVKILNFWIIKNTKKTVCMILMQKSVLLKY